MADDTPSTGAISLGDNAADTAVGDVFGLVGSSGFSMSEYRNADSGIPSSGAIRMSDLRGRKRHSSESESWRAFRYGIFGSVYPSNSLFARSAHIGNQSNSGGDVRYWSGDSGSNGALPTAIPSRFATTGANIPTSRAGNNSVNTVIWGGMAAAGGSTNIYNKQIQVNGTWYVPSSIAGSASTIPSATGVYLGTDSTMRYAGNHNSGTGDDNGRGFRSVIDMAYVNGFRGDDISSLQFRGNWGPNTAKDDTITDYWQLVLPNKWRIVATYGNGAAVSNPPSGAAPLAAWTAANTLNFTVNPWEIVVCFASSGGDVGRPNMSARTGFEFLWTTQINWYGSERQGIYTNSTGAVQTFSVPANLRVGGQAYDNLRVVVLGYVGDGYLNSTVNA